MYKLSTETLLRLYGANFGLIWGAAEPPPVCIEVVSKERRKI